MKVFKNIVVSSFLLFVLLGSAFAESKLMKPEPKFFLKFGVGVGGEYTANNLCIDQNKRSVDQTKSLTIYPTSTPTKYFNSTSIMYPSDILFIELENIFKGKVYGFGLRVEVGANFKPVSGNWTIPYFLDENEPFSKADYWKNDYSFSALAMNYFSHMNASLYVGLGAGMTFAQGDDFYLNYTPQGEAIVDGQNYGALAIEAALGAEIKFTAHLQVFLELDAKFYPTTSSAFLFGFRVGFGGWF